MPETDFIRRAITEGSIIGPETLPTDVTEKYFHQITDSLGLDGLSVITVNTIHKSTYLAETGSGHHYLVFDQYLLASMQKLNAILYSDSPEGDLFPFLYKILSEECYNQGRLNDALTFAALCLKQSGSSTDLPVTDENLVNLLSIQQTFLMAHEMSHFYLHTHPEQSAHSLKGKEKLLTGLLEYTRIHRAESADSMYTAIYSPGFIEECCCDSFGITPSISIALQEKKSDIMGALLAVSLCMMNQFTITTVQEFIKSAGQPMDDRRLEKLFNFRLLHLKRFIQLYLEDDSSADCGHEYILKAEELYNRWYTHVHLPTLTILEVIQPSLTQNSVYDRGTATRLKRILQQICNP